MPHMEAIICGWGSGVMLVILNSVASEVLVHGRQCVGDTGRITKLGSHACL